jgi:hypothetical protein
MILKSKYVTLKLKDCEECALLNIFIASLQLQKLAFLPLVPGVVSCDGPNNVGFVIFSDDGSRSSFQNFVCLSNQNETSGMFDICVSLIRYLIYLCLSSVSSQNTRFTSGHVTKN